MADAIVLADSQPTPVDHTFTPVSVQPEKVEYRNFAVPYAMGRESLILTSKSTNGALRSTINLRDPRLVVENINDVDVPSVPDYAWLKIEVSIPNTHAYTDSEDLVEMGRQALANADIVALITKGISPGA